MNGSEDGKEGYKMLSFGHDVVLVQIYSRCGYLQMTKPVKIPAWIEEGSKTSLLDEALLTSGGCWGRR